MTRHDLGLRLCSWHSSMYDPIYRVGSFYMIDKVYPEREGVIEAISNLERMLDQNKDMLADTPVWVYRSGKYVSLKEFAGYTDKDLQSNIDDLSEILDELNIFLSQDYNEFSY